MKIDWQALLQSLVGQAVLLAAVAWLCKILVSSRLSREADAFKARLKADADIEIERLKTSLQIAATEHRVRFSKLHDQRALVIAKLYRLLQEVRDAAIFFAAHPRDETAGKEQWKQHLKLYHFFHFNKIYLPSALCGLLENYESKLRHLVTNAQIYMGVVHPNPQMVDEQNKAILELWQAFANDLPTIMGELEREFRNALGVEPTVPAESGSLAPARQESPH